jgi:2,3-bisphosphoglycerate-dependent phosphoglycerate mutase
VSDLQCPARIFLARHGEAEYESELLRDHGGTLTRRGREQAKQLGERLRGEQIRHVYASTLARAVQTAELAAGVLGVDVTVREGLHEFVVGDHAGSRADQLPFEPVFDRWVDGDLTAAIPGGETGEQIATRVLRVLDDVADGFRGESTLVVSHGCAIFTALGVIAPGRATSIELPNCASYLVEIDADGTRATRWETGHE